MYGVGVGIMRSEVAQLFNVLDRPSVYDKYSMILTFKKVHFRLKLY